MGIFRTVNGVSGGGTDYSGYGDYSLDNTSTSHTFSNLEVGTPYLLLLNGSFSSASAKDRYDGATATNATITKITNLTSANDRGVGTFYNLVPTSSSVTVSHSTSHGVRLFKAE